MIAGSPYRCRCQDTSSLTLPVPVRLLVSLRPAQPTLFRPHCFEVSWEVCYLVYVLKNPLFTENGHHGRDEFLCVFLALILYKCPLEFLESLSMSAPPQGPAGSLKDLQVPVFASDFRLSDIPED